MSSRGKKIVLLLALAVLAGFWSTAEAQLAAVSPTVDPVNGFPLFYTDTRGLSLQLCLNPANCFISPVVPLNAFSATIGFGPEVFYFLADSDQLTVGPAVVGGATDVTVLRFAVEGGFASTPPAVATAGDPQNGTQMVFARINLKRIINALTPNSLYTVTHPYGTFTFTTDATGSAIGSLGNQAFRVQDGGAVALDFVTVLAMANTGIGPFLTAVTPPPPAGFIGSVAGLQTVTGSPFGTNFFRIDGPNVGGPGINTKQTSLWSLSGQVAFFTLNVAKAGTGTGTVTSTSVPVQATQVNCGVTCSAQFPPAAVVTLTAVPSATSVFSGWTGCTPVVGVPTQCTVTMNANATVAASFNEAVNISPAPTSIAAGNITLGSTAIKQVTVTNTGAAAPLVIGQIAIAPVLPDFTIRTDGCSGLSLAPLASCVVQINVAPGTVGLKSTTMHIPSNDPQTPDFNVPLTATGSVVPVFADVPVGSFADTFINTVFYNGITAGCGAGNYCPNNSITRGEMAVFMERSLGKTPTVCNGGIFLDVNTGTVGSAFCAFIEQFAADGITGGCGAGNYCPNNPVTRAQMAAFIEAALGVTAPVCTGTMFSDVTPALVGQPFCNLIEDFAKRGITGGCAADNPATPANEARFCPNDPVTRAQMAVFLVTAPAPLLP